MTSTSSVSGILHNIRDLSRFCDRWIARELDGLIGPGKSIRASDIDIFYEYKGYLLVLEGKNQMEWPPRREIIPLGQRRTFDALVRSGLATVIILYGDANFRIEFDPNDCIDEGSGRMRILDGHLDARLLSFHRLQVWRKSAQPIADAFLGDVETLKGLIIRWSWQVDILVGAHGIPHWAYPVDLAVEGPRTREWARDRSPRPWL